MTYRRAALWILLAAKAVAGIGVGWDIRWHIVIGRDSFWIAPHVMTYAGVAVAAIVSFGLLVAETWAAPHGRAPRDAFRIAGLVGSRGAHLAWWGIALTIVAAPIDDLWHRLFGIDVTLWSPPHLLGLLGAQVNSLGCLLLARELWPPSSRARTLALAVSGVLLFAGFQTAVEPGLRTAFLHGGVRFFTFAMLGALFFAFTLVLVTRLARSRGMAIVVAATAVVLQISAIAVGDVGMAVLQPGSAVAEAIAADPGSPIAVAHEIARRNGATPGRGIAVRLFPVLPAALLVLLDACRRPVVAGLGFGLALYAINAVMFLRSPAFAHVHPDATEAAIAAALTAIAAILGTLAATTFETRVEGGRTDDPLVPRGVALTPGA
jgi:hypothetical protein